MAPACAYQGVPSLILNVKLYRVNVHAHLMRMFQRYRIHIESLSVVNPQRLSW